MNNEEARKAEKKYREKKLSIRKVCVLITTFMMLLVNRLTHFLYGIVYQQQHKSRDSNAYLSDGSENLI